MKLGQPVFDSYFKTVAEDIAKVTSNPNSCLGYPLANQYKNLIEKCCREFLNPEMCARFIKNFHDLEQQSLKYYDQQTSN